MKHDQTLVAASRIQTGSATGEEQEMEGKTEDKMDGEQDWGLKEGKGGGMEPAARWIVCGQEHTPMEGLCSGSCLSGVPFLPISEWVCE